MRVAEWMQQRIGRLLTRSENWRVFVQETGTGTSEDRVFQVQEISPPTFGGVPVAQRLCQAGSPTFLVLFCICELP